MKKLPVNLPPFYIYDCHSVDMEKLRDPNVYTIGIAHNKDEEDIIVEKFAALNFVMATESSSKLALNPLAKALGATAPSIDDIKGVNLETLRKTNRAVTLHNGFWKNVKQQVETFSTFERALLFELGHYIDPEYMDVWKQHLGLNNL